MVVPQLVSFLLVLLIFAAYLQLAGRVMRRIQVRWRHCIMFACLVGVLTIAGRVLGHRSRDFGAVAMILALALQVAIGGWFFSSRAITEHGEHLGFSRAAILVLVAMGFLLASGLLVLEAGRAYLPMVPHPAG